MLGSTNVTVLQSCLTKFSELNNQKIDPSIESIMVVSTTRFKNCQVGTIPEDFCIGCGEYMLFDGYFPRRGTSFTIFHYINATTF
jgi:hypothetical protein